MFDNLPADRCDHVGRNRKANTDIAAAGGENGRVDADQFAAQIHKWTPGVPRVDRGVRLDEVLVALDTQAAAPQRTDDPRGHRLIQAEGVADRDDEIADTQAIRI